MAILENPINNYRETIGGGSIIGTFLLGGIWFALKGVWGHFFLYWIAAILTFGLSWLIYPFLAPDIIKKHYLKMGWREVYPRFETKNGQRVLVGYFAPEPGEFQWEWQRKAAMEKAQLEADKEI